MFIAHESPSLVIECPIDSANRINTSHRKPATAFYLNAEDDELQLAPITLPSQDQDFPSNAFYLLYDEHADVLTAMSGFGIHEESVAGGFPV